MIGEMTGLDLPHSAGRRGLEVKASAVSVQDAAKAKAYIFAALNFVCPLLSGLFHVHSNRLATLAQVKTSAAIIAELFRKSMRMSNA
jgi:hypothetical protein